MHRRRPAVRNIGLAVDPQCFARRRPTAADLRVLQTGDRVRIDLNKGTADMLVSPAELAERFAALKRSGGYHYPPSQTPWQEIQRAMVDQLGERHGAGAGGQISAGGAKIRAARQSLMPFSAIERNSGASHASTSDRLPTSARLSASCMRADASSSPIRGTSAARVISRAWASRRWRRRVPATPMRSVIPTARKASTPCWRITGELVAGDRRAAQRRFRERLSPTIPTAWPRT